MLGNQNTPDSSEWETERRVPALATPEDLKSKLTALATYLPFDADAEKQRVLATLTPSRPK